MCRISVKKNDKAKVFADDEEHSDLNEYKFLLKDTISRQHLLRATTTEQSKPCTTPILSRAL
jgi:hypothetical protein